jgi:sporulation protein YlmC with PRC-barrel domain
VSSLAKQSKDKGVTKDRLVGMKVISSDGYMIGTVKDIGFTVGKMGISLNIEDKNGEIKEIPWDEVQAAGDFVLLKPATEEATATAQAGPQQPEVRVCPTCKGPLSFIQQYQRWYCYKCQKYA